MRKRQDLQLVSRKARRGRVLAGAVLVSVMVWTGLSGHFLLARHEAASAADVSALATPEPTPSTPTSTSISRPGATNGALLAPTAPVTSAPAPVALVAPAPAAPTAPVTSAPAPVAPAPATLTAPAPTLAPATETIDGDPYLYFVLKDGGSFSLARSRKDANDQPAGNPDILVKFGDDFGETPTDAILSLVLSPDDHYLAIDGTHGDGEQLWMFDTKTMSLKREPSSVSGTFLHWLPNDSDLFLYRAVLPEGPGSPLDGVDWNPGLWVGNAVLGTFANIEIGLPSIEVVDALPSPDGAQILYSTSRGLGQGSDIWTTDLHGHHQAHLMHLSDGAQRIAGMFSWSPDGKKIAYERLNDSPTPFLPASLWVMDRQGNNQRMLAQADGGHGFALRWSPDSSKIAYVARANPSANGADQNVQALQSSVNMVEVASGRVSQLASPAQTGMQINASPAWSTNGKQITFAAYNPLNPRLGGTVHYWSAQVQSTGVHPSLAQVSPAVMHVIALE
ncbi:MAG TPA: hypothetical protein VF458_20595 [Ktedonobacteraceae bacterium]